MPERAPMILGTSRTTGRPRRRLVRRALAVAVFAIFGALTLWDVPSTGMIGGAVGARRVGRSLATPSLPDDDRPTGLRLAFLGDSITRYQYLSLIYYLHNRRWYDAPRDTEYYLVNERLHPGGWLHFHETTNRLFRPHEQCDCYRENGKINMTKMYENRFYYDKHADNAVYYLQAFGENGLQAHWEPETAVLTEHEKTTMKEKVVFAAGDWSTMIREYVAKLHPKPTHLVMNSGLWASEAFHNPLFTQAIFDALEERGIQGIWKTTTAMDVPNPDYKWKSYEHTMCNNLPCFDVGSWTARMNSTEQWDGIHFWEPVYQKMNQRLLRFLDEVEEEKNKRLQSDAGSLPARGGGDSDRGPTLSHKARVSR